MPYVRAITSFVGLQSHEVVGWKRHHKSWIELWLVYRGLTYRCGRCGKGFPRRHDEEPICVRDLDIGPHRVFLWRPRYRVRCPRCGIRRVKSVIVRQGARCTRWFERKLFVLTDSMPIKAIAEQERVHWTTVKDAERTGFTTGNISVSKSFESAASWQTPRRCCGVCRLHVQAAGFNRIEQAQRHSQLLRPQPQGGVLIELHIELIRLMAHAPTEFQQTLPQRDAGGGSRDHDDQREREADEHELQSARAGTSRADCIAQERESKAACNNGCRLISRCRGSREFCRRGSAVLLRVRFASPTRRRAPGSWRAPGFARSPG